MTESTSFLDSFLNKCRSTYLQFAPGKLSCDHHDYSTQNNWLNLTYGIAHPRGIDDVFIRLDKQKLTVDILPGKAESIYLVTDRGGRWISLIEEERSDAKSENFELLPNCPPPSLSQKEILDAEKYAKALYALVESKKDLLKVLLAKAVVNTRIKN